MSIKVCLNCIVKNESRIIKRMLGKLVGFINYFVILDTGSTDNTIELINEFSKESNIKGEVYQSEFKNFRDSRNEALELCQKSKEEFDYILLCDADMNLVFHNETLQRLKTINADVYSVEQRNGNLIYRNVRLIKKNLAGVAYVSPTHEYLDTKNYMRCSVEWQTIYFDDKGDGGCKATKYERDIKILEDELILKPNSSRETFYLAQSYHCIKNFDRAIELYNKRTNLGGWKEEIFICWYRMGNIYYEELPFNSRDYDKAIRAYLKAISANPERAEPIYKLVKMTRECGDLNLAKKFYRMLESDKPNSEWLFSEADIYNYLMNCEKALLYQLDDPNKICRILQNIDNSHYSYLMNVRLIESIKPSYKIDKFIDYDFNQDLDGNFISAFNPSIVKIDNHLYISVRQTNYKLQIINNRLNYQVNYDGKFYNISDEHPLLNRTVTYLYKDNQLKLIEKKNLRLPNYVNYCIQGLEDIRLINYDGTLCYIGNTLETETHKNTMIFFDGCRYDVLKYNTHLVQKNWSPFVVNRDLYFVYSFYPLTVLKYCPENENKVIEVFKEDITLQDRNKYKWIKNVCGGSQGLCTYSLLDNEMCNFIFIAHYSVPYNGRTYLHCKIDIKANFKDSNFSITGCSDPFILEKKGIEYVAGLSYYDGKYLVSYATDDNKANISSISFN